MTLWDGTYGFGINTKANRLKHTTKTKWTSVNCFCSVERIWEESGATRPSSIFQTCPSRSIWRTCVRTCASACSWSSTSRLRPRVCWWRCLHGALLCSAARETSARLCPHGLCRRCRLRHYWSSQSALQHSTLKGRSFQILFSITKGTLTVCTGCPFICYQSKSFSVFFLSFVRPAELMAGWDFSSETWWDEDSSSSNKKNRWSVLVFCSSQPFFYLWWKLLWKFHEEDEKKSRKWLKPIIF